LIQGLSSGVDPGPLTGPRYAFFYESTDNAMGRIKVAEKRKACQENRSKGNRLRKECGKIGIEPFVAS